MRVYQLREEQTVAAPLEEVFAFFAQPENLAVITPPRMGFEILTPSPITMRAGALIDYVVRVGGVGLRWRTLITAFDPPHSFVDEQILGPYSFWHHTHTFAATPAGGTEICDTVRYALPLGLVGRLAHAVSVRRQLAGIFAFRRRVVAEQFDGAGKET